MVAGTRYFVGPCLKKTLPTCKTLEFVQLQKQQTTTLNFCSYACIAVCPITHKRVPPQKGTSKFSRVQTNSVTHSLH